MAEKTIKQIYTELYETYHQQVEEGELPLKKLLEYQELKYRIFVLDTIQAFEMNIPLTEDKKDIQRHYYVVSKFIRSLLTEHKYGTKTDEAGVKVRETAEKALQKVVADGERRFKSLAIQFQQYYKSICDYFQAVLIVWTQYRESYIKIEGGNK